MELKDNNLAVDVADKLDDNYKILMEWSVYIINSHNILTGTSNRACKCGHVEIAHRILARLIDPDAELLQVLKGSIILRVLGGRARKDEHFEILDALFKKYQNAIQGHIFGRNCSYTSPKMHGTTPISVACQYNEETNQCNNERFIQWSLRCFSNSLTVIDLYNTGLNGKLPLKLFEFVKLKVLNVSKNNLSGLTEADDNSAFACNELEEVIFRDNKFPFVPKSLFLLPKLKTLNFANNEITDLNFDGFEVDRVPIERINLSCNNIEVIPNQLFYFPNLMELNLDKNKIVELPVEMWFSPSLVHLSINYNALIELPVPTEGRAVDEFQAEVSTSSLDSNNGNTKSSYSYSFRETMMVPYEIIEFEDDHIQGLAAQGLHLKKLQLDGNKLRRIPADLGCLAPHLSELSVASNELEVTPCLKSLPVLLKKLNLSSNKLTTFLTPIFVSNYYPSENCLRKKSYGLVDKCNHTGHTSLVKLEKLNMSDNLIDDDIYTKYDGMLRFEKLLDLNLSNNRFKTFPEFILHQSSLLTLDVSNNHDIKKIPRLLAKLPLVSFKYSGISDPIVRTLNCFPYDISAKLQCLLMLTER